MNTYHFTLIVDGPDLQSDEAIEALFEAGCDDAMVSRADGIQYVDFDREADTMAEAIGEAVAAIEHAVPGARVRRIAGADLVSVADIARRVGRTRESVRLLVTGERGPGGFPAPVTDPRTRHRLWRWPEVAAWLQQELNYPIEPAEMVLSALNASLELRTAIDYLTSQQREIVEALIRPPTAA